MMSAKGSYRFDDAESPNPCVDPSADNVFSLPMKSLIYVSPGSGLGLQNV
jgi:hypothetical protein